MESAYIKFIDPKDKKKFYLYEYVRGHGEMATYRKGRVIGKKSVFDYDAQAQAPVNALKHMVHRGYKFSEYASQEELEGELFLDAFEDF